jgi:hypothetical protein
VVGDVEFAQVQGGDELVRIGGEGVVVVSGDGSAGLGEAAPVVGDDPWSS